MKTNRMWIGRTVALLALTAAVSSAAMAQGPASSAPTTGVPASAARPSDRQLAKSVRRAMAKAGGIDMAALTVRAKNGVVTLAGSVPDNNQIARAVDAAKRVPGVSDVRSKLTVQSEVN